MKQLILAVFLALSSIANAAWVDKGSTSSPMDDTIYQQWENLSMTADTKLVIANQTYKNQTSTFLHLQSLTNRWRPFRTEKYVMDGQVYNRGILYGRIRLDNEQPIDIRFSFSGGNNNTFIHFTRSDINSIVDRDLAVQISKARRILIEVFASRYSSDEYSTEIIEFRAR